MWFFIFSQCNLFQLDLAQKNLYKEAELGVRSNLFLSFLGFQMMQRWSHAGQDLSNANPYYNTLFGMRQFELENNLVPAKAN